MNEPDYAQVDEMVGEAYGKGKRYYLNHLDNFHLWVWNYLPNDEDIAEICGIQEYEVTECVDNAVRTIKENQT